MAAAVAAEAEAADAASAALAAAAAADSWRTKRAQDEVYARRVPAIHLSAHRRH